MIAFPSTDTLRIEHLESQNDAQAETIKALWVQNAQLQKRVDTLQNMVTWRGNRIEQLEAEQTAQAKAERHFS